MPEGIINYLSQLYTNYLYPAFIVVMRPLVNGWVGLLILVVAVMILSSLVKRIKVRIISSIITLAYVLGSILLVLALFLRLVFFIDDLPKYDTSNSSSTSSPSSDDSSSTNSTKTTPTTTPQPAKQLYYYASCSNCYNAGCNRNGYSYGGYSEENYIYYKSLCQSCQCADSKSQSFYK